MTPTLRLAFDQPVSTTGRLGGRSIEWTERFQCFATPKYERGKEAVEAGALTGTATFKVKIRSHERSRAVTTEYRARDVHRGVAYNVREVDAITDRQHIWIVLESGVAI